MSTKTTHCRSIRQNTIEQLVNASRGTPNSDIKRPKQGIQCTDFVKTHLVDQFLEDQRIVGEKVNAPLPIVKPDRSGNDLFHRPRVATPNHAGLFHLPLPFFNGPPVPILLFPPFPVHSITPKLT